MADCFLWVFFLIAKVDYIFWQMFPQLRFCINRDKNVLGYVLGDIFTSSSGHPGHSAVNRQAREKLWLKCKCSWVEPTYNLSCTGVIKIKMYLGKVCHVRFFYFVVTM
jgi:hypothetical protein